MLTVKRQPSSAVSSASHVRNSARSARVHAIYYLEVTMASFTTFRLCKSHLIPTSTLQLPSFTRNTSKSFPLVTVNQCPCGPPCFTQSQLQDGNIKPQILLKPLRELKVLVGAGECLSPLARPAPTLVIAFCLRRVSCSCCEMQSSFSPH